MDKPKVLLSVPTYLPGYRGGGPIQSVKNLVEMLSGDFDFYIFTANHDLGIKEPYKYIEVDNWNIINKVKIFYSSEKRKYSNLKKIIKNNEFSLIFLNSFFHKDSIIILLLRKLLKLETNILIMPRGELSEGALNIKKLKKMYYLHICKHLGLLNNINYLTTADDELKQVQLLLNQSNVYKVSNIPNLDKRVMLDTKNNNKLKIVFLSRIAQKKNLDYALNVVKSCKEEIIFHIYGTIEDTNYWKKCKDIISNLPSNIIISYQGELPNEKVIKTLAKYDLFLFTTKSENYGHVISEALHASIPLLISNTTPWKSLEEYNYGWVYSLSNKDYFVNKIDELAKMSLEEHNFIKQNIYYNYQIEDRVKKIANDYQSILSDIINMGE